MMPRRTFLSCLTSGVLVGALIVGAPASAKTVVRNPVVTVGTDCTETEAFFLVDMALLDEYVPDPYAVGEIFPGLGELMVTITSCEDISVAGKAGAPGILGKAGIYIDPPTQGFSAYDYFGLWQVGNVGTLRKELAKFGLKGELVADASFASTTGLLDATAAMPMSSAPHAMTIANPVPTGLFIGYTSTFWFETKKGTVAIDHSGSPSYMSGALTFETSAGSDVATIIGQAERPADYGTLATIPELKLTARRAVL